MDNAPRFILISMEFRLSTNETNADFSRVIENLDLRLSADDSLAIRHNRHLESQSNVYSQDASHSLTTRVNETAFFQKFWQVLWLPFVKTFWPAIPAGTQPIDSVHIRVQRRLDRLLISQWTAIQWTTIQWTAIQWTTIQ